MNVFRPFDNSDKNMKTTKKKKMDIIYILRNRKEQGVYHNLH